MFPERIVCLAAEVPEILHELGVLDRVVGISAYTTRPSEALVIPKVSGFQYASIERVLAHRPQLAILTSGVQRDLAIRLGEAGVTLLHLNPHRLDDLFSTIELLGNLVGVPDKAKSLCVRLRTEIDKVAAESAKMSWRPRVYFEEWMDPLLCGTGWVSDLIELAGGVDVFRERAVSGRKAAEREVSWQEVVERQPDIILASWCGKSFKREVVIGRPHAEEVPAVRSGEIHELTTPILQCGPCLVDSLREVHALIRRVVERKDSQGT